MRFPALVALSASSCGLAGTSVPDENWTCDWDAMVDRPLADPDTPASDAGLLPASECMTTCGPPVSSCERTTLDGGEPAAVCPFCTF
jgi:hypothetical protein